MNVLVIEDERLTAQRLIDMIHQYDRSITVLAQIPSVAEAIAWFRANPRKADLVFMDIHLEDGDSFRIVTELQLTIPIIFTTAFDHYMVKAFKVNSIDYLLKPVNYDELAFAIDKYRTLRSGPDLQALITELGKQKKEEYKDRFMITVGTKIRVVNTTSIAYFFLEEKTVLLATDDGTTLPVDFSLDRLMQVLDPNEFFRISRQFVVSARSIRMVHVLPGGRLHLDVHPKPRYDVAVSGDRATAFKEWLGKD